MIPEPVLDTATLLGGLSALWFFVERLMPAADNPQDVGVARPRAGVIRNMVAVFFRGVPMSPRVALGLQWVITVYALSYFSAFAVNIGLLLPVWVVPLAFIIHRFVVREPGVARIVGGVTGGVLGAAIAHALIDWATPYGLTTGIFFGTLAAGHVATPTRQTSAFSLVAGTALLLFTLGVFRDFKDFLEPSDQGFIAAAFAIVLWLYVSVVVKMPIFQRLWRRVRKALKYPERRSPAA